MRCPQPSMRPIGRRVGMVAQVVVGDQDDARAAVGHLAAVEAAQPALDDGVDLVIAVAGRRSGTVQSRVCAFGLRRALAKFSWRDGPQVGLVDAVATVVLVGDLGEHVGPHELGVGALVADPRGRAEVLGGGVAGHGLLQLDADDQRGLVGAGAQVGDRGQRRDAARRAGRLVAGRRGVPQAVDARWPAWRRGGPGRRTSRRTRCRRGPRRSSAASISRRRQRRGRRPRRSGPAKSRPSRVQIAREVALVAAEDPDAGVAHARDGTTTNRVTPADSPSRGERPRRLQV